MSWLARALGDFGTQTGEASSINQDFASKQQDIASKAAQQKLAALMGPLQLQELQARVKELNEPKPAGIIQTQGGGNAGVTTQGGKYSVQPLTPGADKNAIKAQISAMAAKAPKEYQGALEAIGLSIDNGEDPLKALDKANTLLGQAAGKEVTNEGKTKFKFEPEKGVITGGDGKEWSVYDPQLPPELKTLVDAERQRKREDDERKATLEAKRNADALTRALAVANMQEAKKAYDAVFKTAQRGAALHTFLGSVESQVEAAKANGGVGTTSGDLTLVEGFMQAMFGVDPRALRGSPQMQQSLLQQGGWSDKAIAEINNIRNGGRLSQDVREQILDATRSQIAQADTYVNLNGNLVDDPRVKTLVGNYNKRISGTGSSLSPAKKNDATDLGGTPAGPTN